MRNGSYNDRMHMETMLHGLLSKYPERKCKVYLLHGDMSDAEVHALYVHPKIKALVSLSHGEGFGLPLFEASYSGLPIIAPGWSGQCDFLYAPKLGSSKRGKKKNLRIPYFAEVDFTMGPISDDAVWDGVLEKDSMWCYPQEGSYKMKLRQVRKGYDKWKKKANSLQDLNDLQAEIKACLAGLYQKYTRISFVCYLREKIAKCPNLEEIDPRFLTKSGHNKIKD